MRGAYMICIYLSLGIILIDNIKLITIYIDTDIIFTPETQGEKNTQVQKYDDRSAILLDKPN